MPLVATCYIVATTGFHTGGRAVRPVRRAKVVRMSTDDACFRLRTPKRMSLLTPSMAWAWAEQSGVPTGPREVVSRHLAASSHGPRPERPSGRPHLRPRPPNWVSQRFLSNSRHEHAVAMAHTAHGPSSCRTCATGTDRTPACLSCPPAGSFGLGCPADMDLKETYPTPGPSRPRPGRCVAGARLV
eukprot:scaffold30_cov416-Prasinococcus_capsulatus_cf.AAC.21